MTETLSNEESNGEQLASTLSEISADVKAIALTAEDRGSIARREFPVGDSGSMIVVARKKTEGAYDFDLIVSKFTLPAGSDRSLLKRETFRWASNFLDARDLQIHESVDPDAKRRGEPVRYERKGFSDEDLESLRELVAAAKEAMDADG